jgi:hypothetical protein
MNFLKTLFCIISKIVPRGTNVQRLTIDIPKGFEIDKKPVFSSSQEIVVIYLKRIK